MLKPPKCLYIKHFGGFSTFKILHFLTKIQSKFHTFSDASFWMSFFEILAHPGANTLDFGTPLAPSWAPNDDQNRPRGANNAPKDRCWASLGPFLESSCFQDRFRNAPGHHFFGFLMDFDPLFKDFLDF